LLTTPPNPLLPSAKEKEFLSLMGASLIPAEAAADLAVLLASDRFRYTTADILTVEGGLPEAFPR
jgi:hypothetical protein